MSRRDNTILVVLLAIAIYAMVMWGVSLTVGFLFSKAAGKVTWAAFGLVALVTPFAYGLWQFLRHRRR